MTLPPYKHERRSFARDKTNPANHARYTVLWDGAKWLIIDEYKKRYDRMHMRIVAWANTLKALNGDVYYRHITLTYDTHGTVGEAHKWMPNDIRDFELKLRSYINKNWTNVIIWGMAWVGEIQSISKNYHYELMIATSDRIYFPLGMIDDLWGRGFIKISEPDEPWYLVAYCKKKNQKDYWYFPPGARGFGVWVSPCAYSGIYRSKVLLRFHSLKIWQMNYLIEHNDGGDLVMDLEEKLYGVRSPPSKWRWMGSWVKLKNAENQVAELGAENGSI